MGIVDKLFDRTQPGLEKILDLTTRRNSALASNIANVDTPQYRAMDLNFAKEVEKAFGDRTTILNKTNSKHIDIAEEHESHFVQDYSGATKGDGNNVDLDIQMNKLAHNKGQNNMAIQIMRKKLNMLRAAISYSRS